MSSYVHLWYVSCVAHDGRHKCPSSVIIKVNNPQIAKSVYPIIFQYEKSVNSSVNIILREEGGKVRTQLFNGYDLCQKRRTMFCNSTFFARCFQVGGLQNNSYYISGIHLNKVSVKLLRTFILNNDDRMYNFILKSCIKF